MIAPDRAMFQRLPLVVGASMLLATGGCLTRSLWAPARLPTVLEEVPTRCVVHDVTITDDHPDAIQVLFSTEPNARSPAHLRRFDGATLGRLSLTPAGPHRDWRILPGAEFLQPDSWDFRVTRGTYFRGPHANARVTFHGTLRPAQIAVPIDPRQLPTELRTAAVGQGPQLSLDPDSDPWQARCLDGFAAQRWIALVDPEAVTADHTQTAVAWLDPERRPVAALPQLPSAGPLANFERIRVRRGNHLLLCRLDSAFGVTRWIAIPAVFLQHGDELRLRRTGDTIAWSRTEIWTGSTSTADASGPPPGVAFAVPLRSNEFEYRWLREHEQGNALPDPIRVLLTPFTAIIDFIVMTNPYLANALRELTEESVEVQPTQRAPQR